MNLQICSDTDASVGNESWSYTRHAVRRMQQRGIHPDTVDLLLRFGSTHYRKDARVKFFDKQSRERLQRHFGRHALKSVEHTLNTYLVLGQDGSLVTVAHRTRRFRRKK